MKRTAIYWTYAIIWIGAILMLTACTTRHIVSTEKVKVNSFGPCSVIEDKDMMMLLASDFTAKNLEVTRTLLDDGTVEVVLKADELGAARSPLMAELPAILEADPNSVRAWASFPWSAFLSEWADMIEAMQADQ